MKVLDKSIEGLEEITRLVEEVEGNLSHIYKAVGELKSLCLRPGADMDVDQAVTRRFASELDKMIKGAN
jgi:hypothetical protein